MLLFSADSFNITPIPTRGVIPAYRSLCDTQELTYLGGNDNYSYVYRVSPLTPLLASRSLKYFEQQLPQFVRISKRYLVNPTHIRYCYLAAARGLVIELTGGQRLTVARRRCQLVRHRLASVPLTKMTA